MKKLVFLLVCLFSIQTMLWADNDKPIHVGQLPTKAQTLITTYFKNHKTEEKTCSRLQKKHADIFKEIC